MNKVFAKVKRVLFSVIINESYVTCHLKNVRNVSVFIERMYFLLILLSLPGQGRKKGSRLCRDGNYAYLVIRS